MASSRLRGALRWALPAAVALALLLQLIPAERSNPPVKARLRVPAEIEVLLRRACYDCHSHETRWPWYSRVAPVSWWLADHVRDAREELNFSDWPFAFEEQEWALRDVAEQVEEDKMPLRSYRLLHPEARLDAAERAALVAWARGKR